MAQAVASIRTRLGETRPGAGCHCSWVFVDWIASQKREVSQRLEVERVLSLRSHAFVDFGSFLVKVMPYLSIVSEILFSEFWVGRLGRFAHMKQVVRF